LPKGCLAILASKKEQASNADKGNGSLIKMVQSPKPRNIEKDLG